MSGSKKKTTTSDSALGQSKSTKTIYINFIRIMRIFHYKLVSKSINSNTPYDEKFVYGENKSPSQLVSVRVIGFERWHLCIT